MFEGLAIKSRHWLTIGYLWVIRLVEAAVAGQEKYSPGCFYKVVQPRSRWASILALTLNYTILNYYNSAARRWTITDWSPCSVSCGLGAQTREMVCKQHINSALTMNVAGSSCPSPVPANVILSKACQRPACAADYSVQSDGSAHWFAGTWSKVRRGVSMINSTTSSPHSTLPPSTKMYFFV